ncbi:MAG TPA: hypothetical protein VLG38_03680 [Gammaproteobacteria bacterium]|nr:hypothetical protein [Gammaproteobacteria bacterium]
MAFSNQVTTLQTYKQYLREIGIVPSAKLESCFACGLPAVWLYLKAIGLEDLYFDMLAGLKKRTALFKELIYLLIFTNGHNTFFPHIPKGFLTNKVPPAVAAAQVQLAKPSFEMAYEFSRDQLTQVLSAVTQPNYMVRIGNQRKAIGIMCKDDTYHVYHANNPRALQFNDIEECVNVIMRVMNERQ